MVTNQKIKFLSRKGFTLTGLIMGDGKGNTVIVWRDRARYLTNEDLQKFMQVEQIKIQSQK